MRLFVAVAVVAGLAWCQAPTAVFKSWSATTKEVDYGTARCTMWVGLPAPWPRLTACYESTALTQLDVGLAAKRWDGTYSRDDGSSIGWTVTAAGAGEFGVLDPNGVKLLDQAWAFPPGN
jgi:hypothetical protein